MDKQLTPAERIEKEFRERAQPDPAVVKAKRVQILDELDACHMSIMSARKKCRKAIAQAKQIRSERKYEARRQMASLRKELREIDLLLESIG